MKHTLLLELGTEELPARFVHGLLDEMADKCARFLNEYRVNHEQIKKLATPRRLTLKIEGVATSQETVTTEKRGPSYEIAFDQEGNPTRAAEGFARSQGVDVGTLQLREEAGKTYVYAVKQIEGKNTVEVLPEIFQQTIYAMELPVRMFWKSKQQKFVRPVRWIVAMMGAQEIPFSFGDVRSSHITRGHRFLGKTQIVIDKAENYESLLNDNYVMVDHQARKQAIQRQVEEKAAKVNGEPEMPAELLDEVNFLVEWPTALLGEFSSDYLDLPGEILINAMQSHQKYFPVWQNAESDQLLPYFIAIRNGDAQGLETVKRGNERVLKARLADARFFFEEDRKHPLASKCEALKHIVYREELGSLYEKVNRMEELGRKIAGYMNLTEPEFSQVLRTIRLSKADLVTNVVDEFPKLQGIMGEKYARMDGEAENVAKGLGEHYLPRHTRDQTPSTITGAVTSLADKVDNIASSFAIGERPSGNQDPFALRRQAVGIVNVIVEGEWSIDLTDIFRQAIASLPQSALVADPEEIVSEIMQFIKVRIKTIFQEYGLQPDLIDSVLAVEDKNVYAAFQRGSVLQNLRNTTQFANVVTSYQRLKNLSERADGKAVDVELLDEESEIQLYQAYNDMKETLDDYLEQNDIENIIQLLASVKPTVDAYFDNVLVMAEDEALRQNRLNLIYHVKEMFRNVAEFSLLQA